MIKTIVDYRLIKMVGPERLELSTPCTPCKCATRLRHGPTIKVKCALRVQMTSS